MSFLTQTVVCLPEICLDFIHFYKENIIGNWILNVILKNLLANLWGSARELEEKKN